MALYRCFPAGGAQVKKGSATVSTSAVTINCGFKPKYVTFIRRTAYAGIYDEEYSTTKWVRAGGSGLSEGNLGAYGFDITSNGFILDGSQASSMRGTVEYYAIG